MQFKIIGRRISTAFKANYLTIMIEAIEYARAEKS